MNFRAVLCCFGVLAAVFAVSEGVTPPQIPCSFSADLEQTTTQDGKLYTGRYMYYSIENVGFAMVGVPVYAYPGNCTQIFHLPNKMTTILPFVNHHICASLPAQSSLMCITFPPDTKLVEKSMVCPVNTKNKCDHWAFEFSQIQTDVFVRSDTSEVVVDRVVMKSDSGFEQFDFFSFSPVPPPASVLEVPKTQPCIDYMDGFSHDEPILEVSPFHFGTPIISERKNSVADMLINDPRSIKRTNNRLGADAKWKAGPSPFFDGMTYRDLAKMLQKPQLRNFEEHMKRNSMRGHVQKPLTIADDIPSSFDSREAWPKCNISGIRVQGSCGSCWAFGSSEELADRICIETGEVVLLSPQYMVNCYSQLYGCQGGFTDISHQDMIDIGVPLESCVPYKGVASECKKKCDDGSVMKKYKLREMHDMYKAFDVDTTVRAIQTEIMNHGPVVITLHVFDDFPGYATGIYSRSSSNYIGDHIVKIIGWGEQTGTPYWIIANSWGESWGEKGFFRMVRGKNDCSIEDTAIAGTPDV